MRYFYIEPSALQKVPVTITGSDARHIHKVLRLQRGDFIGLLDGAGNGYRAQISRVNAAAVTVEIIDRLQSAPRPPVRLVVAQAYLKDKKMDRLVRRLCELGMAEWKPFVSSRSVARPPEKRMPARVDRWRNIARGAIKQCRRTDMPLIDSTCSFEEVLKYGQSCGRRLFFWEQTPEALDWRNIWSTGPEMEGIIVMLGPEGGFTADEAARAREHGFSMAGLGPRVLRAETASVAACTIVQYVFGDMGPKTY